MKVVELLKMGAEMLKLLSKSKVSINDFRFISMYEEFHVMREAGIKYREVVRQLAEDYKLGRSTVERILKRLGMEC